MDTKDLWRKTIQWYDKNASEYAERVDNINTSLQISKFCSYLKEGADLVLDAGCGSGRDAFNLHQQGLRVFGVDISTGLLRYAKSKYPDIDFIHADLRDLPFKDNLFSGVWCQAALLHLPEIRDVKTTLEEFYRVLAADGVLYVSVKKKLKKIDAEFVRDSLSGAERFFRYFSLEEILQLLQEAGFQILAEDERKSHSRPESVVWIQVFARKKG